MGKKKRSRAERKAAGREIRKLDSARLLELAREQLEGENAGEAIRLLRQVRGRNGQVPLVEFLLFRAYHLNSQQLRARGLDRKAGEADRQAKNLLERIDPRVLSDPDFSFYVNSLDLDRAINTYADSMAVRGASSSIEYKLGQRLVLQRRWDGLSALDPQHPLRLEAEIVQGSIPCMDRGDWQEAAARLRPLSRHSPFASWRIFCKAMSAYCRNDGKGVEQGLKLLLPQDFALAPALRRNGDGVEQAVKPLLAAVNGGRRKEIRQRLISLADTIYPEDLIEARVALLHAVGVGVREGKISPSEFGKLARDLLPADQAAHISAKIEMLAEQASHDKWNVEPAVRYVSNLEAEFSDPQDRSLARARVLEFLARSGHSGDACADCLGPGVVKTLRSISGPPSGDRTRILIDLMLASLVADPLNREGYDFALSLMRRQNVPVRNREEILKLMAKRFSNDPQPCLELARLSRQRNAYRQVENWLEEAARRAPHDESVLDSRAVAYFQSAGRNLRRGKLRPAEQDLRKVEQFGGRRTRALLPPKRRTLELLERGESAFDELESELESMTPLAQIRFLSLLVADLREVGNSLKPGLSDAGNEILKRRSQSVDLLQGAECVELLKPLDEELQPAFPYFQPAAILADCLPGLLARAEGDHLVALFDILLKQGADAELIGEEISRRLHNAPKNGGDPLLRFYQAVIRCDQGREKGAKCFREILETSTDQQRETLRKAALNLSEQVKKGPLQDALRSFDFELLERPPFHPPIEDPEDPLVFADLEFSGEAEDEDDFDLFAALRNLIRSVGMEGAPDFILRELAALLRQDSMMRRELNELAREFRGREDELERELRILLFPGKSGSKPSRRKKRQPC